VNLRPFATSRSCILRCSNHRKQERHIWPPPKTSPRGNTWRKRSWKQPLLKATSSWRIRAWPRSRICLTLARLNAISTFPSFLQPPWPSTLPISSRSNDHAAERHLENGRISGTGHVQFPISRQYGTADSEGLMLDRGGLDKYWREKLAC